MPTPERDAAPSNALPVARTADTNLHLREHADGILRQFVRSKVLPTQATVKGGPAPARSVPVRAEVARAGATAAPRALTLADLREQVAPPPPPGRPPPPRGDGGWDPHDVLARGKGVKPLSKSALVASALARLKPKG